MRFQLIISLWVGEILLIGDLTEFYAGLNQTLHGLNHFNAMVISKISCIKLLLKYLGTLQVLPKSF